MARAGKKSLSPKIRSNKSKQQVQFQVLYYMTYKRLSVYIKYILLYKKTSINGRFVINLIVRYLIIQRACLIIELKFYLLAQSNLILRNIGMLIIEILYLLFTKLAIYMV